MEGKKRKILIVDDEKMNLIALTHFFKPQYEIIVATNGSSGLESAKKQMPDLILLDVIMPEMDGFDVLAKLKESETTKNIPVVFLSGLDNSGYEEKGLSLGAAGYITKPFDKSIIIEKTEALLQLL